MKKYLDLTGLSHLWEKVVNYVQGQKVSPAFTGVPTAPTAASGTNTTQIATTAFVQDAVSNVSGGGTFTAVYGETTYEEIKAAYDAGKKIELVADGKVVFSGMPEWESGRIGELPSEYVTNLHLTLGHSKKGLIAVTTDGQRYLFSRNGRDWETAYYKTNQSTVSTEREKPYISNSFGRTVIRIGSIIRNSTDGEAYYSTGASPKNAGGFGTSRPAIGLIHMEARSPNFAAVTVFPNTSSTDRISVLFPSAQYPGTMKTPVSDRWKSVVYGMYSNYSDSTSADGNQFVAIGDNNMVVQQSSRWISVPSDRIVGTGTLRGIGYSKNRWVLVRGTSIYWFDMSESAVSGPFSDSNSLNYWHQATISNYNGFPFSYSDISVVCDNGIWFAYDASYRYAYSVDNGETWTVVSLDSSQCPQFYFWMGKYFRFDHNRVSPYTTTVHVSGDGVNWDTEGFFFDSDDEGEHTVYYLNDNDEYATNYYLSYDKSAERDSKRYPDIDTIWVYYGESTHTFVLAAINAGKSVFLQWMSSRYFGWLSTYGITDYGNYPIFFTGLILPLSKASYQSGTVLATQWVHYMLSYDDSWTYKLSYLAPATSPQLNGTPTTPTAKAGTNSTQIASTEFVQNAIPKWNTVGTQDFSLTFNAGNSQYNPTVATITELLGKAAQQYSKIRITVSYDASITRYSASYQPWFYFSYDTKTSYPIVQQYASNTVTTAQTFSGSGEKFLQRTGMYSYPDASATYFDTNTYYYYAMLPTTTNDYINHTSYQHYIYLYYRYIGSNSTISGTVTVEGSNDF